MTPARALRLAIALALALLVAGAGAGPARSAVPKAEFKLPGELSTWENSRHVERLDLSNYQKYLATKDEKGRKSEYIPESASYGDPNFRASGDIYSQIRIDSLGSLGSGTAPVLVLSEFEPALEWKHTEGRVEKFFLKFGAAYQRDRWHGFDRPETEFYFDETYAKLKFGKLDLKLGNLIETLGSGDEVSNLDVLNPRNYRLGLGVDSTRAKIAVPMVRTNYYLTDKLNLECHVVPIHMKPKLAEPTGVWATKIQQLAALADPTRFSFHEEELGNDIGNAQTHVALNIDEENLDLRLHLFHLFEPLPIVNRLTPTDYALEYPRDDFVAVDGSLSVLDQFTLRYEFAYHNSRTFTSFQNGVVGAAYSSDQMQVLLGIDKLYPGDLYFNVQGILSNINDFQTKTQMQQYGTEFVGTFRGYKSFMKDLFKLEFQALENFTTEEYILKPSVTWRPTDAMEFTVGVQVNDGGRTPFGPIDQYHDRNHLYYESVWRF